MKSLHRFWQTPVCVALAGVCVAGCATSGKPLSAEQRATIRQRAEFIFENAVLLKPAETASSDSPGAKLAPLFVQEVHEAIAPAAQVAPMIVYFSASTVLLASQTHVQVSYTSQLTAGARRRGVRITLNPAGLAVIWEALNANSS